MPVFAYEALDDRGKKLRGIVEADSAPDLVRMSGSRTIG